MKVLAGNPLVCEQQPCLMRPVWPTWLILAAVLSACTRPADVAAPAAAPLAAQVQAKSAPTLVETGIAWTHAASDADVDAAFAQARAEGKPVFVYWGAQWCPPCNQVKATLFNRADFIERSRSFVPVYVDGDAPGAQKLGARFRVRGYPTMLLFNAQGEELTRLPGEVDAAQYTLVLTLGMNAQRPVKAVLGDARTGGKGLTANDWRLLAFYSWETDEQQLVRKDGLPALLKELAGACPAGQAETATRLMLKALAAADPKSPGVPDPQWRGQVLALLADAPRSRAQMDVLTNSAADLTRALSAAKTPERAQLLEAFEIALKRLEADTTLSRADRMTALIARVELANIDIPKGAANAGSEAQARPPLPQALLADAREHSARADREITDAYERQAVIPTAAYLLEQAGLLDESDALLKANLAKSHSPYYLMSGLASNAKKRGDKASALGWHEQAFNRSEGAATRLQWGASYVEALVELAPQDEVRIERTVQQLFNESAAQPNAFYERSGRSLQRVASKLLVWNKAKAHSAVLQRLQGQLAAVCLALDVGGTQRESCDALFQPKAAKSL